MNPPPVARAAFFTGDADADRALYGVVGARELDDTMVARARELVALTPREEMLLRNTDDEFRKRAAVKRARLAQLSRSLLPPTVFRVGWSHADPSATVPITRAIDIPWLAFVNALRVRMIGTREVVREGGAVRVESVARAGSTEPHTTLRGARAFGRPEPDDFVLPPFTPARPSGRRFAVYSRRAPNPTRYVLLHVDAAGGVFSRIEANLPRAEVLPPEPPPRDFDRKYADDDDDDDDEPAADGAVSGGPFEVEDARIMPPEWFSGESSLVPDFPRYDSLLWFGVTCAFERDLPFVVRSGRAVVRLAFPAPEDDITATHDEFTGRVECRHTCELVFMQLECGDLDPNRGPNAAVTGYCVRVPANLRVCQDRVQGVTVAIPGVPSFRFAIKPLSARTTSAPGTGPAMMDDNNDDPLGNTGAAMDDEEDMFAAAAVGGAAAATRGSQPMVSMTYIIPTRAPRISRLARASAI